MDWSPASPLCSVPSGSESESDSSPFTSSISGSELFSCLGGDCQKKFFALGFGGGSTLCGLSGRSAPDLRLEGLCLRSAAVVENCLSCK